MSHNYDIDTTRTATIEEDADWQRVNSYVADALKDCYVLFAKLARLRSDFTGMELKKLDKISSDVRDVGQLLAIFSKAFNEGKYSTVKKEQFGENQSGFEQDEDFDFSEDDGSDEPPIKDFGQDDDEVTEKKPVKPKKTEDED
jgi:hypothetical protein